MNYFLIYLLTSISLLPKKVILIVRLPIRSIKTQHDVVFIIQPFCCFRYSSRMLWILLFELRLIGVFGHIRFVTTDGEVAFSITAGEWYT